MTQPRGITYGTRALTAVFVVVLASLASAAPAAASCAGPLSDAQLRTVEQQLLASANGERAELGAGTLVPHTQLQAIARRHAVRMASEGTISHNQEFLGSLSALGAQALAENVGKGCTADHLHAAFMVSPKHRANIVHDGLTHAGFGAASDASGVLYVVQTFAIFPPPPPPAPAPVSTAPAAPAPVEAPVGTSAAPVPVEAPAAAAPATAPPATPEPQPVEEPVPAASSAPSQRLTSAERELLSAGTAVSPMQAAPAFAAHTEPVPNPDLVPPALAALTAAALGAMMLRRRPKLACEPAR